jgi:hypothetical protein
MEVTSYACARPLTPLLKTRMTGSLRSIIKTGRSNIDELEKSSIGVLVRICACIAC